MKRFVVIAAVLLMAGLGALSVPTSISAGPHYVEPCLKSTLCKGLVEYFNFAQEGSNQPRYGAFGSVLLEPTNGDILNRVGQGGVDVAPEFSGSSSSFLWQSYAPGPTGFYTVALWVYPDTAGVPGDHQHIISWNSLQRPGPSLYLANSGTLQVFHHVYEQETGNVVFVGQNISAGAWHLVVFGASSYLPGGTNTPNIFISVDGAARSTATLGYFTQTGCRQVRIGCQPVNGPGATCNVPFDGAIDKLGFWNRDLTTAEITLLYNSGSGQAYPFVTE